MSEAELSKIIMRALFRLLVDWPICVIVIRLWVWSGLCEFWRLPQPSWRQAIGLSFLLVSLT